MTSGHDLRNNLKDHILLFIDIKKISSVVLVIKQYNP